MAIMFYNTLTRQKEEFKPIEEGAVGIYSCGPTVYNYAHIGNWRSFIFADILRRYLIYKGYDVFHVMNLTDVDDKTIRDSQKEGVSLKEFCDRYTGFFFKDMETLNIEKVDEYPKATDHIKEMVDITKDLLKKGLAYKSDDGSTYYDVSKFKGYGKLSRVQFDSLKSDSRIKNDEYEKDAVNDFALWKSYEKDDGDVFWDTDLGKGRPGWHIECSAMSTKYLGKSFDIHTGGIDLIFPHHENEIAQSEGWTKEKFVNYWLHCEHLLVNNEKMSKSKGNFFVLKDILEKGHRPMAVRYLLLSTHYRQKLNFTFEGLEASQNTLDRFREFIIKLRKVEGGKSNPAVKGIVDEAKEAFEKAMDDDLNVSGAVAAIFDFMREINKILSEGSLSRQDALLAYSLMMELDRVLGVMDFEEEAIPAAILDLARRREEYRKAKDFKRADEMRAQITKEGYVVDDTPKGPVVKKV